MRVAAVLLGLVAFSPETTRAQPANIDEKLRAAAADFRAGRLEEARRRYEEVLSREPSHAAAWKGLGMVHAAQGSLRLASKPFRKACELDPRLDAACYFLGRNLYSLNQFDEAAQVFEKALPLDAQRWRVHAGLALALEAIGRTEEAERHFREAVRQRPAQGWAEADPRIELGAYLFRQGRLDEALAVLADASRDQPGSARARFELGRTLYQLDRLQDAAAQLERAVDLDSANAPAHLLLGKIYHRLGRVADAERHARLGRPGPAPDY
jgi:tetratricopeptide (TPR) repeat protein